MKRDEGAIFSKTLDWKSLFLLKIKIKQNSGCPSSKEFNAIFRYINQKNVSVYHRSKKKSELIEDSKNFLYIGKKSEQSEALLNKLGLFQIHLGGLGESTTAANKIVI